MTGKWQRSTKNKKEHFQPVLKMALSDIKTIAYSKGLKYALPIH